MMASIDLPSIQARYDPQKAKSEAIVDTSEELSDSSIGSSHSDSSQVTSITGASSAGSKAQDGHTTYYPHPTTFKLSEHPVDQTRSLKVRDLQRCRSFVR